MRGCREFARGAQFGGHGPHDERDDLQNVSRAFAGLDAVHGETDDKYELARLMVPGG